MSIPVVLKCRGSTRCTARLMTLVEEGAESNIAEVAELAGWRQAEDGGWLCPSCAEDGGAQ